MDEYKNPAAKDAEQGMAAMRGGLKEALQARVDDYAQRILAGEDPVALQVPDGIRADVQKRVKELKAEKAPASTPAAPSSPPESDVFHIEMVKSTLSTDLKDYFQGRKAPEWFREQLKGVQFQPGELKQIINNQAEAMVKAGYDRGEIQQKIYALAAALK